MKNKRLKDEYLKSIKKLSSNTKNISEENCKMRLERINRLVNEIIKLEAK